MTPTLFTEKKSTLTIVNSLLSINYALTNLILNSLGGKTLPHNNIISLIKTKQEYNFYCHFLQRQICKQVFLAIYIRLLSIKHTTLVACA